MSLFLIEYNTNQFVNGYQIQFVGREGSGELMFGVEGDDYSFTVDSEFEKSFVAKLQTINSSYERLYDQLAGGKK